MTAPFKTAGLSFETPATLKYHVVEQDNDLARRVRRLPHHGCAYPHGRTWAADRRDGDVLRRRRHGTGAGRPGHRLLAERRWRNPKSQGRSEFPGVKEAFQFDGLKIDGTSQAGGDGAVAATMTQTAANATFNFDVDPGAIKAAKPGGEKSAGDAQPYSVTAKTGQLSANVKLDGLKTRPLLDLWAFLIAHPTRFELAANEAAFKSLLAAALANQAKVEETASVEKIAADIPQGEITINSAKFGASGASGPMGAFGEHFEANGLTLPPTLIPGPFKDSRPDVVRHRVPRQRLRHRCGRLRGDRRPASGGRQPLIAPDNTARLKGSFSYSSNGIMSHSVTSCYYIYNCTSEKD